MTYEASDVSNISDEIIAMMSAYIPDLLLVFAILFSLWFFRQLFKTWTGF